MTNTSHEHAPKTDVLPLLDISLVQILPVRFMPYKVPSMKKSIKEKLWSILIEDGRAKVFRDNVALKSCHSGQEYECLIGVTVKVQSNKKFIQVKEKEVSLKELKKEANNVRALSQVKEAVVNFF